MTRLWPWLLAAAISACTPTRVPEPAPVSVPDHWRAQAGNAASRSQTVEWWKTFGDARLNSLVSQALQANTDIAQAAARVLQARAELAGTEASLRPEISALGGVDQVRVPAMRLGGQRFAPENATWPYAGFSLDYKLDVLGRLAKSAQSAAGLVAATEFERQQVRQTVVVDVVKAYADLRHAERLLQIDERRAVLADELALQQRRRLEAGLSDRLRMNEAERNAQNVRIAKVRAEREREPARARLALLISRPVTAWRSRSFRRRHRHARISQWKRICRPAPSDAGRMSKPPGNACWPRRPTSNVPNWSAIRASP